MARPRNEETIQAIGKAARKIILEQGYEAATYSEIAKRTGIARTTIQHYVPKKEALATDLMQDVANRAIARAWSMTPEDEHMLAKYYLAGQISHGIYYSTSGLGRLLCDVSADLHLRRIVVPQFEIEKLGLMGLDEDSLDNVTREELVFVTGGIYEVHYACITEGRVPNISWLVRTDSNLFARIAGMSNTERDELFDRYAMDNDELLAIGTEIAAELLSEI